MTIYDLAHPAVNSTAPCWQVARPKTDLLSSNHYSKRVPAPTKRAITPPPESKCEVYNYKAFIDLTRHAKSLEPAPVADASQSPPPLTQAQQNAIDLADKRAEQIKLANARNEAAVRKQAAAAAAQAAAAAEAMDAMYRDLKHEISTVLPAIFKKIESKSASERQRAERQARLWRIETFEKGNDQVLDQVEKISTKTITRRRNQLYQKYLDELKAKPGGLYLDVPNPNYDPFAWKKNVIKYKPAHDDVVKKDLIKTSLEKAAQLKLDRDSAPQSDARSPPPPPKGYVLSTKLLGPLLGGEVASRDTIPVERWQNLGKGMYYDKAFEQAQRSSGSVMALPEHTKVDCLYDLHYNFPQDQGAVSSEWQQFYGKGKRSVH